MAITKIHAHSVYDSRCSSTVEIDVVTKSGLRRAIVLFGTSTDQHEAVELRDGELTKWLGNPKVDEFLLSLDGTPNKGKLGANTILGVSLAIANAAASEKKIPLYAHIFDVAGTKKPYVLPVPFMNVLNGGPHTGGGLATQQEFMIVPFATPSFSEALRQGAEVYQKLKSLAKKKYSQLAGNVGGEGSFAHNTQIAEEALKLIPKAIKSPSYASKVYIAIDVASIKLY